MCSKALHGTPSRVCATGHIHDSLPLVEKSRTSCPGGRFPHSFMSDSKNTHSKYVSKETLIINM